MRRRRDPRPGAARARDHAPRLGPRVLPVDAVPLRRALEDRDEDLQQEPLRLTRLDAGARELERGLEQRRPREPPVLPCASARPATSPGTATDDGPTWKICVEASPKSITTSSIGPCGREGTAKKQSSSAGSPPASRRSRKPPPAGPVSGPSATNAARAAATTASTALPPAARAHAPASAVCRLPAAIAPRMGRAYGKGRVRSRDPARVGLAVRNSFRHTRHTECGLDVLPSPVRATSSGVRRIRVTILLKRRRQMPRNDRAAPMRKHLTKRHWAMAAISLARPRRALPQPVAPR